MSYGYQWLTDAQRKHITSFSVHFKGLNYILSILRTGSTVSTFLNIHYKSIGGRRSTLIVHQDGRELFIENEEILNVISEDIAKILNHKKTKLFCFSLLATLHEDCKDHFTVERMRLTMPNFYGRIENLLMSRGEKLGTEEMHLSVADISEVARIILQMNPLELKTIVIKLLFNTVPSESDFVLPLTEWNQGERLKLVVEIQYFSRQYSNFIKKLISHGEIFNSVEIAYVFIDIDALWSFSKEQYSHHIGSLRKVVTFEVENTTKVKIISGVTKMMAQARLQKSTSQKVFENGLIMKVILAKLECSQIQCLRKASSGIRDCVDRLKPDSHLTMYSLELQYEEEVIVHFEEEEGGRRPAYKLNLNRLHESGQQLIKDFDVNTRHQKSPLERLELIFSSQLSNGKMNTQEKRLHFNLITENFLQMLKVSLANRRQPLRVKKLEMYCQNQSMVMQVLLYIDINSLEVINLSSIDIFSKYRLEYDKEHGAVVLELDQVSQLEQWRNAKELVMTSFIVTTPIRDMNITHFSTVDILVQTVQSEDILYLKQELMKSSTIKKFKIAFEGFPVDDNLHSLIGEPYRRVNDFRSIWYFRIENTNQYLHFVLQRNRLEQGINQKGSLVFARVEKEATPFF